MNTVIKERSNALVGVSSNTLNEGRGDGLGYADEPPSATFIVSDSSIRDYDGDVVEVDGIDTTNWEANGAIWSFGHFGEHQFPIGSSIHPQTGQLHWSVQGKQAIATCFFDEGSGFSMEVFRLVSKGLCRGASVAFVPGRTEKMDHQTDALGRSHPGQGFHFQSGTTLTEISVVPIGSNSRALLQSCSGPVMKSLMKRCIGPHCEKDFSTQADLDVPGIAGRNPNPNDEPEQEDGPDNDPPTDEITARYGDADLGETADDLLDHYRFGASGTDPNHMVGHGTNQESKALTETPDNRHVIAMYSHAKEERDFLDQLDGEAKDAMQDYIQNYLSPRMQSLKDMIGGSDEQLDEQVRAFEKAWEQDGSTTGVDGPTSSGEALLINQGDIPEEEKDECECEGCMAGKGCCGKDVDPMTDADLIPDDDYDPPVPSAWDDLPDDEEETVQAMNDERQNPVTKSWEDQPADPMVIAEFNKLLRFLEMEKVFGDQNGNGGSPGLGRMKQMIEVSNTFQRSPR